MKNEDKRSSFPIVVENEQIAFASQKVKENANQQEEVTCSRGALILLKILQLDILQRIDTVSDRHLVQRQGEYLRVLERAKKAAIEKRRRGSLLLSGMHRVWMTT
jgi:hypothetical protein